MQKLKYSPRHLQNTNCSYTKSDPNCPTSNTFGLVKEASWRDKKLAPTYYC
ncbi:hypothetical protein D1Q00_gp137 [Trichoplusia ni granulovirus LBIV-12]|uniref:Uncharacterized protein n=2 Tax=Betabaculovirus TaxID=558017 RepID=A0A1D8QLH0_GVTN|nr:hypothetical protein PsunGV_gp147 [Pseudalatia unipuncta granulovirus]YP_009506207.1 hypothetical protein D1Q00_gp137 [Trichoplusia ni granulovirus LBIV-12]ACH69497.1 unknown [Pseudalatia unipuncta granulovirus]AOW41475.1 hypothetical protein [Trichoplusia ni granulovirus LBIV-12]